VPAKKLRWTNSGFVNLTVNSVAASGGYGETDTCSGLTLTPGQTCHCHGTFTPVVTGTVLGDLTINDTTTGAPHVVSLNRVGTTRGYTVVEPLLCPPPMSALPLPPRT